MVVGSGCDDRDKFCGIFKVRYPFALFFYFFSCIPNCKIHNTPLMYHVFWLHNSEGKPKSGSIFWIVQFVTHFELTIQIIQYEIANWDLDLPFEF